MNKHFQNHFTLYIIVLYSTIATIVHCDDGWKSIRFSMSSNLVISRGTSVMSEANIRAKTCDLAGSAH